MEEERFKFVIEVQKNEKSFMTLCREFGISRPTGYKWWGRYSEARDPIEHGMPKFGLDFVFVNRYGKGEFNGKKLKFSRALRTSCSQSAYCV